MKYRVQLDAVFNNTNANSILNHAESIKDKVYNSESPTEVDIIRKGQKSEVINDFDIGTIYENVNFDASQASHSGTPEGTEFKVGVDISFAVEQDLKNFLNYIESIKSNASSENTRSCRFFECRHEENTPLAKDGEYSYIDFDGEIIEH